MALTLFGLPGHPHAIAATKTVDASEKCVFDLDFSRPIERIRWLGVPNRWAGFTLGLLVPIIHRGEETGKYVFSLRRGQPYFRDMPLLWREHGGSQRTLRLESVDGLEIIADFARHFPDDC